jgi:hypothetical protein
MAENTKNQKTTGEKVKSTVKDMAGKVLQDEAQKTKKGILAVIWSFIFGGLFGGFTSGDSNGNKEDEYKNSRFLWTLEDEDLYSEAKDELTHDELIKIGVFEDEMEGSDFDFVFFRKVIANKQKKYNKATNKPAQNPAVERLRKIIQAKDFKTQMLVVGSSMGQKEFLKKKNIQKADKIIGSALIVVAISVFLVLISLFSVVLFTVDNF